MDKLKFAIPKGSRSNPNCLSNKSNYYLKLGASSLSTVLANKKTLSGFSKNLGEKLWIN